MPRRTSLADFVARHAQQVDSVEEPRRTTYYLLPSQAKAMKMLALKRGYRVSELAREAIDAYLAKRSEE